VTGERYADAAAVSFVQPYWNGDARTEVEGVVHLVEVDGEWGWFWGTSRASVDQQIALYAPDELEAAFADLGAAERVAAFPDQLHAHVDAFWAGQFAFVGRPYNPPEGVVPIEAPLLTACGRADPATDYAFYCFLDETIYYSGEFRRMVEAAVGDFGWVVVVAHEWGHHIQSELDLFVGLDPDSIDAATNRAFELQADCLAGAYTRDAERRAWLHAGDVDEATLLTALAGDPPDVAASDRNAHGTGEERLDAFLAGYEGGIEGCGLPL